ncbi:MAG: hypothetical protein AAGJ79_09905, partial [Verrucomicrobiota bacterium]
MNELKKLLIFLVTGLVSVTAEEMTMEPEIRESQTVQQATRDIQNPTSSIKGIFFSNSIGFGPTSENNLYDFQIQPIVTVADEEWGSLILRAVVPVLGVPVSNRNDDSIDFDTEFGLSDTVVQAFYVPRRQDGEFSFGFGPQISLKTQTDSSVAGAGWGGGALLAGFGFNGPLSYGGLLNHLWGEEEFSTTTLQPIVF